MKRLMVLLLGVPQLLLGQELESEFRRRGEVFRESFEPLRELVQASSVAVYDGRRAAGYGVVMSKDGWVMVKASEYELLEKPLLRIGRSSYAAIEEKGRSDDWDLVLLKVEAEGLTVPDWGVEEPAYGTVVFSNSGTSRTRRRAQFGVISATARAIGGLAAGLGFPVVEEEGQVLVDKLEEADAFAELGLREGDVLLSLDGERVEGFASLLELIKDREAGEMAKIEVERGEESLEFEFELEQLFTRNDAMSGEFSARRGNFPRVLQHDTPMSARTVGGPLFDLQGRVIGMNIAFASREASYAIPAKELLAVFEELKAG